MEKKKLRAKLVLMAMDDGFWEIRDSITKIFKNVGIEDESLINGMMFVSGVIGTAEDLTKIYNRDKNFKKLLPHKLPRSARNAEEIVDEINNSFDVIV